MSTNLIRRRLRENILHGLNQSGYILLISYAFDGLINMNPTSFTLFVNLAIVKFLNDIVLRSTLNTPSSQRRSQRSGPLKTYDLVVPEMDMSEYGGTPPPHDYYTPSGTITLLTFYFTYLITGMIYREEVNVLRIFMYVIILLLVILFKAFVMAPYPPQAIFVSLIVGILFGITAALIVASINISLLPSGINESSCPNVPVVSCAYQEN
jgi:hypothetical protein